MAQILASCSSIPALGAAPTSVDTDGPLGAGVRHGLLNFKAVPVTLAAANIQPDGSPAELPAGMVLIRQQSYEPAANTNDVVLHAMSELTATQAAAAIEMTSIKIGDDTPMLPAVLNAAPAAPAALHAPGAAGVADEEKEAAAPPSELALRERVWPSAVPPGAPVVQFHTAGSDVVVNLAQLSSTSEPGAVMDALPPVLIPVQNEEKDDMPAVIVPLDQAASGKPVLAAPTAAAVEVSATRATTGLVFRTGTRPLRVRALGRAVSTTNNGATVFRIVDPRIPGVPLVTVMLLENSIRDPRDPTAVAWATIDVGASAATPPVLAPDTVYHVLCDVAAPAVYWPQVVFCCCYILVAILFEFLVRILRCNCLRLVLSLCPSSSSSSASSRPPLPAPWPLPVRMLTWSP